MLTKAVRLRTKIGPLPISATTERLPALASMLYVPAVSVPKIEMDWLELFRSLKVEFTIKPLPNRIRIRFVPSPERLQFSIIWFEPVVQFPPVLADKISTASKSTSKHQSNPQSVPTGTPVKPDPKYKNVPGRFIWLPPHKHNLAAVDSDIKELPQEVWLNTNVHGLYVVLLA